MAEQQAPALPQDIQDAIRGLCTDSYAYWKANATEEQKAVGLAEMEKYTSDPAFVQAEMTFMQTSFDAQSPVDGRLDGPKYLTWIKALQANGAARGNFEDNRDGPINDTYVQLNKITAGTDGVSMDDFN